MRHASSAVKQRMGASQRVRQWNRSSITVRAARLRLDEGALPGDVFLGAQILAGAQRHGGVAGKPTRTTLVLKLGPFQSREEATDFRDQRKVVDRQKMAS